MWPNGNLAEILARQYVRNPFFADIIKSAVLARELQGGFNPMSLGSFNPTQLTTLGNKDAWVGAAAMLCIYINKKETTESDKEIWLNAIISQDDAEELAEAQTNKDSYGLIFPGLTLWTADSQPVEAKDGEKAVAFKLKGCKYAEIEGKFVISRLMA